MKKELGLFFLLIGLNIPLSSFAQRTAMVEGESEYVVGVDDNITFAEAKQRCIDEARTNALKKEFGEMVVSDFIDTNVEVDGKQVGSYTGDEVRTLAKGDWLGDTQEPEISIEFIDGKLYFKAHVWGEAREVVQAQTDVSVIIQRQGAKEKEPSTQFLDGENFFVNFQSPIDGYVVIYLEDIASGVASCLLPYRKSPSRSVYVKSGRAYTFFDKELDNDPNADKMRLRTSKAVERDNLVVIFSPKKFTKCIANTVDAKHPDLVPIREFRTWLRKNQKLDNEMVVVQRSVKITNPNVVDN